MPSDRVLQAVLHNFLVTFTSRNADYQGYWLMGFLVWELVDIDLLGTVGAADGSPPEFARRLACLRFREQLARQRLGIERIAEARVRVERPSVSTGQPDDGSERHKRALQFIATAAAYGRHRYECRRVVSVWPHNPRWERRSARAGHTSAANQ